ncbi:hypothetical protein [Neobacillus vireti]|uniref:hypothetical protein n=1 Tax=Neobacillus vireti TaxID=220686 RepID=UPI00300050F4
MDKVVIAEVFDFVTFHVCKALLDKGIEVRGVQIEAEENEEILMEKKLEIGRNSNFTEVKLEEILMEYRQNEAIILSVYDLYMRYKENLLRNECRISKFIHEDFQGQFVMLVPSKILTNGMESDAKADIIDFINRIKKMNVTIQILYLPTIYGPWQPDTFLFQQSILKGMDMGKGLRGLREQTNDALFIEDAVESILETIEKKIPGNYLLQSGKKDQWDLCAEFLGIKRPITDHSAEERVEEEIISLTVKSSIPISEALTKQMDHTRRLNR